VDPATTLRMQTAAEYAAYIGRDGSYATDADLTMVSDIYNCRLVLWQAAAVPHPVPYGNGQEEVHVVHNGQNDNMAGHFDAALSRTQVRLVAAQASASTMQSTAIGAAMPAAAESADGDPERGVDACMMASFCFDAQDWPADIHQRHEVSGIPTFQQVLAWRRVLHASLQREVSAGCLQLPEATKQLLREARLPKLAALLTWMHHHYDHAVLQSALLSRAPQTGGSRRSYLWCALLQHAPRLKFLQDAIRLDASLAPLLSVSSSPVQGNFSTHYVLMSWFDSLCQGWSPPLATLQWLITQVNIRFALPSPLYTLVSAAQRATARCCEKA